jgi:hypothetical protein
MTTIITRLFADAAAAKAAVDDLLSRDHDPRTINVISGSAGDSAVDRIRAARVGAAAAAIYAGHVEQGRALVVVAAPFNPVGTARDAMRALSRHPAMNVGVADENVYMREQPRVDISGKVDSRHTLWMTRPGSIGAGGPIFGMAASGRKPGTSAIRGGAYMSTKFWPMRLVTAPKQGRSASSGGGLMFGRGLMPSGWTISGMFGVPLVTRDYPRN